MPSSDQIVWTSSPRRSASLASSAIVHGAWTRPPNGVRMTSRQSPKLVAEALDDDPAVGRQDARRAALVLEVGDQVLGRQRVEVVVALQALGGLDPPDRAAFEVGLRLSRERAHRAPELDRPAHRVALPERQLARDARRGRDRDPVGADLGDAPGARAEDHDVAVHAGAQLVDHLLVELADPPARRPGLALEEHREQAAVGDRAAAGDGDDPRVPPPLDRVGQPVPDDPRLELGELVARVGAREHAEDALEDLPRERLERRGAADDLEQLVDRERLADGHRDELLGEHVERVARQDRLLDRARRACPSRRRRSRGGRRGTWGRSRPSTARRPGARPGRSAGGPRATEVGLSTWITRSTAPMSMPSSRLDVATRAGRRPAFSSSSISRRCSLAMLPWWARTSSSPASSLRRWASRSARRRLLVKTIVLRCSRISSRIRGWIAGQMLVRSSPPTTGPPGCSSIGRTSPRRAMSSTGTTTWSSSGLRVPASTIADLAALADAAEEPGDGLERPLGGAEADALDRDVVGASASASAVPRRRSRRSRLSARWAPRLVPAIAWTSSTITCSTPLRISRAWLVSRRYRLSGVVTRMSGGWRTRSRRSSAGRVAGPRGDRDAAAAGRRGGRPRGRCRRGGRGGCARRRRSAP